MSEPDVDLSEETRRVQAEARVVQLEAELAGVKARAEARERTARGDLRDLRRDHLALHVRATELARDLGRARDEAALRPAKRPT